MIHALSEEHGRIDLTLCDAKPEIGEILHIIPNHACPVSKLFDQVTLHRSGEILRRQTVSARGCVT